MEGLIPALDARGKVKRKGTAGLFRGGWDCAVDWNQQRFTVTGNLQRRARRDLAYRRAAIKRYAGKKLGNLLAHPASVRHHRALAEHEPWAVIASKCIRHRGLTAIHTVKDSACR